MILIKVINLRSFNWTIFFYPHGTYAMRQSQPFWQVSGSPLPIWKVSVPIRNADKRGITTAVTCRVKRPRDEGRSSRQGVTRTRDAKNSDEQWIDTVIARVRQGRTPSVVSPSHPARSPILGGRMEAGAEPRQWSSPAIMAPMKIPDRMVVLHGQSSRR